MVVGQVVNLQRVVNPLCPRLSPAIAQATGQSPRLYGRMERHEGTRARLLLVLLLPPSDRACNAIGASGVSQDLLPSRTISVLFGGLSPVDLSEKSIYGCTHDLVLAGNLIVPLGRQEELKRERKDERGYDKVF